MKIEINLTPYQLKTLNDLGLNPVTLPINQDISGTISITDIQEFNIYIVTIHPVEGIYRDSKDAFGGWVTEKLIDDGTTYSWEEDL